MKTRPRFKTRQIRTKRLPESKLCLFIFLQEEKSTIFPSGFILRKAQTYRKTAKNDRRPGKKVKNLLLGIATVGEKEKSRILGGKRTDFDLFRDRKSFCAGGKKVLSREARFFGDSESCLLESSLLSHENYFKIFFPFVFPSRQKLFERSHKNLILCTARS